MVFFFGRGVTSAHFHILGSRCCLSDALMMVSTGKARHSAYSFSTQLLMPSGPAAFAVLRLDNNLKDLSSDISKNSGSSPKGNGLREMGSRYSSRGSTKALLIALASSRVD